MARRSLQLSRGRQPSLWSDKILERFDTGLQTVVCEDSGVSWVLPCRVLVASPAIPKWHLFSGLPMISRIRARLHGASKVSIPRHITPLVSTAICWNPRLQTGKHLVTIQKHEEKRPWFSSRPLPKGMAQLEPPETRVLTWPGLACCSLGQWLQTSISGRTKAASSLYWLASTPGLHFCATSPRF